MSERATDAADQTPVAGLRQWLDRLARRERLAIIRSGIKLSFELAAIASRFEGAQATLFPRPEGHGLPVVAGILADRSWIADAMGVPLPRVLERFAEAVRHPIACRTVERAPVHEIVHREIDLASLLPVPTHNELDGGPYISAGLVITRNPETGAQNVAILRCQLTGRNRLGVLVLPRHTHHFHRIAEAAGEPLEVAIVIGVDPLTLLASQAIAPLDQDELEIAGALHRAPLAVVRCLGKNLLVPAEAEIVIEGRMLPGVREPEGPFGEFPQYYGARAPRPVVEVDLVTMRPDALYHTIVGGGREHLLLGAVPREASLLGHLRQLFPGVRDVHLPLGGVGRYHLHIQLGKAPPGMARNVMLAAFGAHYDLKHVIVVDEDVDIHDPAEIEWAVATRVQADRDVLIIPGAQGSRLDPSNADGVGAKMGIDATIPLDAPPRRYTRIRVPGREAVDRAAVVDPRPPGEWRDRLLRDG